MEEKQCCEKFRTMIGGQALIEGIMMRGPEKDAVVVRTADGLHLEVKDRKLSRPGSFRTWPFFRGIFNRCRKYICFFQRNSLETARMFEKVNGCRHGKTIS